MATAGDHRVRPARPDALSRTGGAFVVLSPCARSDSVRDSRPSVGAPICLIVRQSRLPMSMAALVVGLALAGCGAVAPHSARTIAAGEAYAPRNSGGSGAEASSSGAAAVTTRSTWSWSVTVNRLMATTRQRAAITVSYQCSPSGPTCRWSVEVSQTGAARCPASFDAADSIWTGPAEATPRTEHATFTFQPTHATTTPRICVYIG